jgi:hypothetical protein
MKARGSINSGQVKADDLVREREDIVNDGITCDNRSYWNNGEQLSTESKLTIHGRNNGRTRAPLCDMNVFDPQWLSAKLVRQMNTDARTADASVRYLPKRHIMEVAFRIGFDGRRRPRPNPMIIRNSLCARDYASQ